MSTKPLSTWIYNIFRELSVMLLALTLAALPFAVVQAQTVQNPGTPVWSMLAKADHGHGARYAFNPSAQAGG